MYTYVNIYIYMHVFVSKNQFPKNLDGPGTNIDFEKGPPSFQIIIEYVEYMCIYIYTESVSNLLGLFYQSIVCVSYKMVPPQL